MIKWLFIVLLTALYVDSKQIRVLPDCQIKTFPNDHDSTDIPTLTLNSKDHEFKTTLNNKDSTNIPTLTGNSKDHKSKTTPNNKDSTHIPTLTGNSKDHTSKTTPNNKDSTHIPTLTGNSKDHKSKTTPNNKDSTHIPTLTMKSMDHDMKTTSSGEGFCWTEWFDRDDPSGSGDWETLNALHIMYPGQICSHPLDIEAQTLCGTNANATGNVIHVCDTVTGFICRNSDQSECQKRCDDYRVRFKCPHSFCTRSERWTWTQWYDRDDPADSGDWEVLGILRIENPGQICNNPRQIQAQTTSGQPVSSTGDVIAVSDTVTGFVCKNSDQPSCKMCADYRVRFLCHHEFFSQPQCWTMWFDRDNPSGTGDWETIKDLRKEHPDTLCDHPLQIEVRTTAGMSVNSTGNVIYVSDTTTGFVCRNADQEMGMCYDYHVRFLCPPDFCRPQAPGCFTEWFDLDDPSGFGDSETLAMIREELPDKICNEPQQIEVLTLSGLTVNETENQIHVSDTTTGFICRNEDQTEGGCHDFRVRFRCPTEFCSEKVCWTNYFDRDDPTASGDWELLSDLRKKYPEDICEKPLAIEVVTVDTNTPLSSTGQIAHMNSPTIGFVCRNQDQSCDQCFDYKVRFGCPCPC